MKIILDKLEFTSLEEQFKVSGGANLIHAIRKQLPDKVNRRVHFKYTKTPFYMEVDVDSQSVSGLIRMLNPTSGPIKKIKRQTSKLSMSQAVKQFGLLTALKDLKEEFFKCF